MQSRSRPINGDNTVPQSLESTLMAYNIFDKEKRDQADRILQQQCEAVMSEIIEQENGLTVDQRGCLRAQTEVIGRLPSLLKRINFYMFRKNTRSCGHCDYW